MAHRCGEAWDCARIRTILDFIGDPRLKTMTAVLLPVILSLVTFAQTTPAKPNADKKNPPASKKTDATAVAKPSTAAEKPVSPEEIVFTVTGNCAPNTPPENCGIKVSRAEFEKVANAVNPNNPPGARRQLANSYAQLLAMAASAKQAGVDKDPTFQEQLRLQQLTLLAQGLQRKMQESSKPTPQELENFYTENSSRFEELELHRIIIPKGAESKPEQVKELAQKIHDRAAAGEDPDKLQIEAYQAVKAPGTPPTTSLGWKRRGNNDPRHEPQVAQLHAGEVSPPMEDGQAYYIYKLDSKRLIPFANVEKDLEPVLQNQRMQEKMKQLLDSIKPQFNDAYFGPPPSPPVPTKQP